ncbi:TetR/AcrR family transcriptional regulator [Cryptosporangium aurantiacum]|uniref:Transcriptional regulator, TetR family n=1 Tax=Cryptosporangium aurantiacum TaxID=134849 RepID=A0A1M7RBS1_9ACTN|nr:TetR/AcrR family transcriptional regulator [Cryptosporangium aurantiacum]SHN43734.1 transcriptional regulator, TetR family [Cryptosporangium aurantiacum]
MARVFRQQIDEGILNRAATLFARYGYAQTSVQAIADAVGMSKAGLLHYFPTKDALRDAVVAHSAALAQEVLDAVDGEPLGPARDRRVIEALADQAIARPGMVAFLVSSTATEPSTPGAERIHRTVFRAFGADPDGEPERAIRVLGALGALSIVVLAAQRVGKAIPWRSHVIATSFDALGHRI